MRCRCVRCVVGSATRGMACVSSAHSCAALESSGDASPADTYEKVTILGIAGGLAAREKLAPLVRPFLSDGPLDGRVAANADTLSGRWAWCQACAGRQLVRWYRRVQLTLILVSRRVGRFTLPTACACRPTTLGDGASAASATRRRRCRRIAVAVIVVAVIAASI